MAKVNKLKVSDALQQEIMRESFDRITREFELMRKLRLEDKVKLEERFNQLEKLLTVINISHKEVMDSEEVALYTGYSIGYIYYLTSRNEIPFLYPRDEIAQPRVCCILNVVTHRTWLHHPWLFETYP